MITLGTTRPKGGKHRTPLPPKNPKTVSKRRLQSLVLGMCATVTLAVTAAIALFVFDMRSNSGQVIDGVFVGLVSVENLSKSQAQDKIDAAAYLRGQHM